MSDDVAQPRASNYDLWAFISYSHQDNLSRRSDGTGNHIQWANWLHEQLETYRIPDAYRDRATRTGEPMPERFFPAFRDEAELPTSHDLGAQIRDALQRSRFLIVIASPRSARSHYVNEEVRYFRELSRGDRILIFIVDGEPHARLMPKPGWTADAECFCPALVHPLRPDGGVDDTALLREEPIAADVRVKDVDPPREMRASERDQPDRRELLDLMKLKLIAGLMGARPDGLVQRDKVRQLEEAKRRTHRARQLTMAFLVLGLCAAIGGLFALKKSKVADANRKSALEARAEEARQRKDASEAKELAVKRQADAEAATSEKRQAQGENARRLVKTGLTQRANGTWYDAIRTFGEALRTDPAEPTAAQALWDTLLQPSGDYLELPDAAWPWPAGARLKDVSAHQPAVLISYATSTTQVPRWVLYYYSEQREIELGGENGAPSFSGDSRYLLRDWDTMTPQELARFKQTGRASSAWHGQLECLDPAAPQPQGVTPEGWHAYGKRFWRGTQLLLCNEAGETRWWDALRGRWANEGSSIPGVGNIVGVDRDCHWLCFTDASGYLCIYDLRTSRKLYTSPASVTGGVSLSADGRVLMLPIKPRSRKLLTGTANLNPNLPELQINPLLTNNFTVWLYDAVFARRLLGLSARGTFALFQGDLQQIILLQRGSGNPDGPNGRYYLLGKIESGNDPNSRWQLHPEREELYHVSRRALCVYRLTPTGWRRPDDPLPIASNLPPGGVLPSLLAIACAPDAKRSEIQIIAERDHLCKELDDLTNFPDLPFEWRRLLKWWTTKPGERGTALP